MADEWQAQQEQQEQENESGIDMHDCYHYHHPLNRLNAQGETTWKSGAQNEKKQSSGSESPHQAAAEKHTAPF
jgi:hypothetical protein